MPDEMGPDDARRTVDDYRQGCNDIYSLFAAVTAPAPDVRRSAVQAVAASCEKFPERFTRAEIVEELAERLEDDDAEVRSEAALALALIAESDASVVSLVVERLRKTFSTDEYERAQTHALLAIERVTREYPDEAAPVLPDVVERLRSASIFDRDCAIETLANAASENQDRLIEVDVEIISSLAALVRSKPASVPDRGRHRNPMMLAYANQERLQEEEIREKAADLLGDLAGSDETGTAVEALADALDDDNDKLATSAAEALCSLAERRPSAVRATTPTLLEAFTGAEESHVRSDCLDTLTALASADTEGFARVIDIDTLLALLDADSSTIRAGAVGLLGFVAEADPGAIAADRKSIIALTADESSVVRANTAMTLGSFGGEPVRETLERLSSDWDEAELVRDTASSALERL